MIPLSIPNFEGNEEKYSKDAVAQGWVSTGGAYINELETEIAKYVGTESAVACQSGTAALHLALMEAGVSVGDLVIVPTLTFIAAVNPVRYCGAEPVFMDCDDTLCMDTVKLREFIETECDFLEDDDVNRKKSLIHKATGKPVKAIIPVHIFGNMADMDSIMELAEKYGLRVIEDATEALGSRFTEGKYKGKYAGTIGDFGAYSFNGNKIITTGGGGMVVARDKSELDHIRYISTQAKDDPLFYIHNEVGYNYRMTNVQAAIGVAQMEELPEFVIRKNNNYDLYQSEISSIDGVTLLEFRDDIYSNKWFYSLLLSDELGISSKEMVGLLGEQGIQTRCIWGLISEQLPYRNNIAYKIEKAKYYSDHIVNLPCSTNLTKEDILTVVEKLKQIIESKK